MSGKAPSVLKDCCNAPVFVNLIKVSVHNRFIMFRLVDTIEPICYNRSVDMNEGDGSMLFRESETIELKEVVVDEIKKRSLLLLTVTVENCILASRMTAR